MDITAVFGTVILGSNPGRCTMQKRPALAGLFCIVHLPHPIVCAFNSKIGKADTLLS